MLGEKDDNLEGIKEDLNEKQWEKEKQGEEIHEVEKG